MRCPAPLRRRRPRHGAGFTTSVAVAIVASAAGVSAQAGGGPQGQAAACPAPARDYWKPNGRIGDLEFDIPAGWHEVAKQGLRALEPVGLNPGRLVVIGFVAPETLRGDPRTYFEGMWAQWRQQFNVFDNAPPEITQNPNGFEVMSRYSRVTNRQISNGTLHFAVARLGNRVEGYFFVDDNNDVDYDENFRGFEHSLRFAGAEQAAAPEAGAPCGLSGLYTGFNSVAGYRNGIVREAITKVRVLVFLPDGNVMRSLPAQGMANFDFGVQLRRDRDNCGRYRVLGDQFQITWADGSVETGRRDGANLDVGGWSYVPAADADNATLEGVYRLGGPGTYGIQFAADGRFRENGILPSIDYLLPNKSPGAGTYRIHEHTMELHYSDGRVIPVSFYVFADDAGRTPRVIHLGSVGFGLSH